ncbi:CitMHS family transporter [Rhodococcus sp. 14-2470-1a]|uniref:CitMHS family transporter n=1 Tax=Rhodococcus sp. 14-2470-1a TaxID=2023150 RepID=UPI000B9C1B30|nr:MULTISPECIES: citrate:proton symporter [unclassified Rhodococcus (in: high G+C Gram-positive bacteria)]OZC50750.1 damage-inducible protein CinA [Rhodococcus sp. 06-621-2]OZF52100.1 damage-inducible protein CinA [Rhodococcus sp. 14-2470-1a]
MLAVLGFVSLASFMLVVIKKWATALVAVVVIPIVVLLISGRGADLPEMVAAGIETVSPTAILLLFAVLYFGVMMDARLFDPVSRAIIRLSGGDPVKICVGTAVLALLVALDGDGTTSYMIICSAFLPIYRQLGINPLVIATISTMALGTISGTTPWGGAATRAISVLGIDATDYFVHMLPAMLLMCAAIIGLAYLLGRNARKNITPERIAEVRADIGSGGHQRSEDGTVMTKATWRTWANAAATVTLLVLLVFGVADLLVLFMLGFILVLVLNHPRPSDQGEVIRAHAANAVPVVILVLGAGVFTGILTETGMTTAMANALISLIPDGAEGLLPAAAAVIGIPLSFFMANDAYFFGIVPVLAESAAQHSIPPEEMARAAVIGQMAHSIGPASAPLWVLLGLVRSSLGDFQRFAFLWVMTASLLYVVFAVLTGAISLSF